MRSLHNRAVGPSRSALKATLILCAVLCVAALPTFSPAADGTASASAAVWRREVEPNDSKNLADWVTLRTWRVGVVRGLWDFDWFVRRGGVIATVRNWGEGTLRVQFSPSRTVYLRQYHYASTGGPTTRHFSLDSMTDANLSYTITVRTF